MQFQAGESGNPAGRPRGARNKRTVLAEQLLETETDAIVRVIVGAAKQGDMAAARLCFERICPRLKDRPAAFALPPLRTAADAVAAMAEISQALADGDLTPAEAADLGKFVASFAQTVETADLEARITRLEASDKPAARQSCLMPPVGRAGPPIP